MHNQRAVMKAVLVPKIGSLELMEVPMAKEPKEGEIRIRVRAAGICGSDMHVLHGRSAFASYPRILGHEFVGEVESLGAGVAGLRLGDHVAIDPVNACGNCYACKSGRHNVCRDVKVFGVHIDGGFSEYFTLPAKLAHKISDDVPWEHAATAEPYSIAAEALSRGGVREDDHVLICGAGPIGLTILQAMKRHKGPKVMIMDTVQSRLERALLMDADAAVNPKAEDLEKAVRDWTCGEGVNLIFEATGNLRVLEQCVCKLSSPAARVVVLGFPTEPAMIPPIEIMKRELDLLGSRLNLNKLPEVIRWIEKKEVDPASLITHVYPSNRAKEAFELLNNDPSSTVKVILTF